MARNFILLSGGPGLYDPRDREHDVGWANYVTPALWQTQTAQQQRRFRAPDEELWWFVFRPAYEQRWRDDLQSGHAERRAEAARIARLDCGGRRCGSYTELLEWRARQRGWRLRWIDSAADLWSRLGTFQDPIARLYYWGHANVDLWLRIRRRHTDGAALAPAPEEIISVDDISRHRALRSRFLVAAPSRRHIFFGCNTHRFANEWARVFSVYTRGYEGRLSFASVPATGGPSPASGCMIRNYRPGGGVEEAIRPAPGKLPKTTTKGPIASVGGSSGQDLPDHGHPPQPFPPGRLLGLESDEPVSPALVFDAFASSRNPGIRRRLGRWLELVVSPGDPVGDRPRTGDWVVTRALGEGGLAQAARIEDGGLVSLSGSTVRVAGVEGGCPRNQVRAHPLEDMPAKGGEAGSRVKPLAGPDGRLDLSQVILRPRVLSGARRDERPIGVEYRESVSIDTAAAVPAFSSAERVRLLSPLLDVRHNADAIRWNRARHPSVSGVQVAEIRRALARYVDLGAVRTAIRRHNSGSASGQIVMGSSPVDAVFVEAIHQFQRKCYLDPRQIDGKAGESTLDSLGLVNRMGMNAVDRENRYRRAFLHRQDREIRRLSGGEFSSTNWFDHMVQPSFLGRTFTNGIHLHLLRRLRVAEHHLLTHGAYRGLTPADLGHRLQLDERHKGARPTAHTHSMHTLGLAVDIKYTTNPWVAGNPSPRAANRYFIEAMSNAALLISGVRLTLDAAYLHRLGSGGTYSTADAYDILHARDQDLRRYLALDGDRRAIGVAIAARVAAGTRGVPTDVGLWARRIRRDLQRLRAGPFRAPRNPLGGFLNLHRDLVVALRDDACLAWGAVDFGPRASGDMMHFDDRRQGLGRLLNESGFRPAGCVARPVGDTAQESNESFSPETWDTEDSTRNVLLYPARRPNRIRMGPLAAVQGGLVTDASLRARVSIIVGPGATPRGIAEYLRPLYAAAATAGHPTPSVEQIAQAILVYNQLYLSVPHMRNYRDGLRIPLPIEIDGQSGDWVLNADSVRLWASSFQGAWSPLLDRRPDRLRQPDPADIVREVQAFLHAQATAMERGIHLQARVMTNPFDAVFLVFAVLRRLGAGAFAVALRFLDSSVSNQLQLLATLTSGRAILQRLAMALSRPPSGLDVRGRAGLERAQRMLQAALEPGGVLTPHRELPETPQQRANRPGGIGGWQQVRVTDPPGGIHRLVLGRDVLAGVIGNFHSGSSVYRGPAYGGRIPPAGFIQAHQNRINPANDPRLAARLQIVQAVAVNEGFLDAVRMRDRGILSVGLQQWSAHADLELPALLWRYKRQNPHEFMLFFGIYDLDVRQHGHDGHGNPRYMLQRIQPDGGRVDLAGWALRRDFFGGRTTGNTTSFRTDWAARVREAAIASLNFRSAQILESASRFDRILREVGSITVAGNPVPLNQLITSQLGVAYILDAHINMPGHVRADLQAAANAAGVQPDPNSMDREVTHRYATIRHTHDTARRNANIDRQGLDINHGSFGGW